MSDTLECLTGGTHCVIDLDAYVGNLRALRAMAPPGAGVMAIVKADAYGHGAVWCSHEASAAGVEWLGVARIAEALLLRREGVATSILVLGPPAVPELTSAVLADVSVAVGSEAIVEAVLTCARSASKRVRVHVKVDTGMHRYGFSPEQAPSAVERLRAADGIDVEGVFTHFASADDPDSKLTAAQAAKLAEVIGRLEGSGWAPRWTHQANSAAILTGAMQGTNLVRAGIASYGLSPSDEVPVDERFAPVMSVRSVLGRTFTLRCGEGASYNWTYRAASDERLGIVPVGYADGLPRGLSNNGWFVVNGQRCPIRGRVCMDQSIISLPDTAGEGDAVLVHGGSDGSMSLNDMARFGSTNCYEVATRVMPRVPRIYLRRGVPYAWEHMLTGERGRF